ncbi:Translation initiation factor 2 [Acinetobacter haemolyticus CIP 64.3 = MTCC 9819]|uniref:Translation initiation factor IF-2 n=2 Tax=Acinetobacter haemolyticus TaxID=29430 RepID=A0AAW4J4Z4_ACIHA|nr:MULTISPECIES: translation initiation factor IF-2 [Acinetobacter]ENW16265.1 translation initiation factor IF-2 [Acinetobacter haemolyticus CIP 64.3 = MTCC 9819]EPR90588.1 Translation initiation factor 2 [Acinetobacter haemolyticus CIP 64.3 = MTCC 9819]MBN6533079.1 translation initiation factor IF-2 [Acinetobacter pittii]MBO3657514.1 translation initiation factor IF-2 [Acinetobacter haemolyticus]QXZ27210.1 translation initiation factor IF-2 [Acinetobacter haemolyticus]
MTDKSIQELALSVERPVEKLLEQVREAGLPQRKADDIITTEQQDTLVNYLKKVHGQESGNTGKIALKRKTTSTAKVTSTSGKAKSINVEVRKKQVFAKPNPELIAAEAKARAEAEAKARVEQSSRAEAEQKARNQAEQKANATLEAMRAAHTSDSATQAPAKTAVVVKKRNSDKVIKAPVVKPTETAEQKKAREAQAAQLKATEEAVRRKAAEEAQQRTLEQMRKMASKYSSDDATTTIRVIDDSPLAAGLVGQAYEDSFNQEDREIKRGGASNTRGQKKGRNNQEEQSFNRTHHKRGLKTSQSNKHGFEKPVKKQVYDVEIGSTIVVADLAQKMAVKVREVIKMLMKMGELVTQNQSIDQDTAVLVVEELGHNPILVSDTQAEDNLLEAAEEARGEQTTRPPVVTIMGHVDHGKTSLLDRIRRSKVAAGEAGGITQHIGAYHVETEKGIITFLDTPGHAAFTSMRSRGAKATDIVVLVVAADDGVMPQTAEAIDHARAAGTPIIVAINKMDKESADPDRVLNELTTKGIVPEEWGGDVPIAKVSAHSGQGIDELLDLILIQSELMELKASAEGAAQGVVIEARVDKGRGAVTSILVQNGTLNIGDLVLAGSSYGRVRAMSDENGQRITTAGPSIPVEILGLPEAPMAGDEVLVVNDEKKAREVADARADRERQKRLERASAMRLENIMASMGKKDVPTVNVVLKTDVRGTLEALHVALDELSTDEVKVRVIGSGVGAITESDVTLAESSEAVLLGFNVRADNTARQKSDQDGIDIRYYSIIYQLIDDVKAAMSGKLAPEHRETILGVAQVREVFRSSKFGAAAGCMVMEGVIHRNKPIRVLRDDVVVFQGELESLRRYKDVVEEVRAGMECGLAVKGYNDIKELDKIEVYDVQLVKRSL